MSDPLDARGSKYWAAFRADESRHTVDAVIRLADNEQAELRATIERVRALPAMWISDTADGRGFKANHWRGPDYVEGRDAGLEDCADNLRIALDGTR